MSGNAEHAGRSTAAGTSASVDACREEMWAVVSRSWSEQVARRKLRKAAYVWGSAGLGLAAMLLVGILVGRWSADIGGGQRPTPSIIADEGSFEPPLPTSYRVAVEEHLRRAETFLLLFESSEQADAELVGFARELAATSRMLMESDVGRDAQVRALLLDLEFLLVQVARLVDNDDPIERQIVRNGIARTDALARLRQVLAEQADVTGI